MKKFFSLLAVLAVTVLIMTGTAFATFTSSTTVALATITAEGDVDFGVELYNWNSAYDGSAGSTDTIHWDNLNTLVLSSNTAQFRCANVYALLKSTITTVNAKIYLYTDNQHNTDGHQAVEASYGSMSGLVDTTGKKYATLAYMCKKLQVARNTIDTLPANAWEVPFGGWHKTNGVRGLFDKGDSDWATKKDSNDVIIAGSVGTGGETRGVWFYDGEYGLQFTEEDVVMFFGALFLNVISGESYGTNTITFDKTIE